MKERKAIRRAGLPALLALLLAVQPATASVRFSGHDAALPTRVAPGESVDRRAGGEPAVRAGMTRDDVRADSTFSGNVNKIAERTGLTRNAEVRVEGGAQVYYDGKSGDKLMTVAPSSDGSRTSSITLHAQGSREATIGVKTEVGELTTKINMSKGDLQFVVTEASAQYGVAAETTAGRELILSNRDAMVSLSPGARNSIDSADRAPEGSTLSLGVNVRGGLPVVSYSSGAPSIKAGRGMEGGEPAVAAPAVLAPTTRVAAAPSAATRSVVADPAAVSAPSRGTVPLRATVAERVPTVDGPATAPLSRSASAAVIRVPEASVVVPAAGGAAGPAGVTRAAVPETAPAVDAAPQTAPAFTGNGVVTPISALSPEKAAAAADLMPALAALAQVATGRDRGTSPERITAVVSGLGARLSPQTGVALTNLAAAVTNPAATRTDIMQAVGVAKAELQKSGIYLEAGYPQPEGSGERQTVNLAVYRISGGENRSALGAEVPVFQIERVGGVGHTSPGFHPDQSNHAFVTRGPLSGSILPSADFLSGNGNFALGMTTNVGVQPQPGGSAADAPAIAQINGIVRETVTTVGPGQTADLIRTGIGDHEAFHAAFEAQGGESRAAPGEVSAVQEHGAYTHFIARIDTAIMPVALTILANQAGGSSHSGTQVGATRALASLQQQMPDVKFMTATGRVDVQGFANLLKVDPVRIQAAASRAMEQDIIRPYLRPT